MKELPVLSDLTYYPLKEGRNIEDKLGNKYYYFELIDAGYTTTELDSISRVYPKNNQ